MSAYIAARLEGEFYLHVHTARFETLGDVELDWVNVGLEPGDFPTSELSLSFGSTIAGEVNAIRRLEEALADARGRAEARRKAAVLEATLAAATDLLLRVEEAQIEAGFLALALTADELADIFEPDEPDYAPAGFDSWARANGQ